MASPRSAPGRLPELDLDRRSGGSAGHPEVCTRPCLFFASGSCINGRGCGFCHMEHQNPPVRLGKRQQKLLTNIPRARALSIIFSLLHQRLLAHTAFPACRDAFSQLCDVCGVSVLDPPAELANNEESLVAVLSCMNIRRLVMVLQRSLLHEEPAARRAADAFVQRLLRPADAGP